MNINRHNYEEYFILYMDNELGSDDRRMVETFVQQHPDLKEELDILLHYKLEPDTSLVFNGKEELMKVNGETPISLSNYEEWLVLYADNELTSAQRKTVEQFAAANPLVNEELALIMKAKLQPEKIVFPYKESLYRKEEKVRVIPFRWLRVAAAVIIIALGITSVLVINNRSSVGKKDGEVATTKPGTKKQTNPATSKDPQTNTSNPVVAEKIPGEKLNETAVSNPVTNKVKETVAPLIKQQDKNLAKENKKAIDKNQITNNPVPKKEEEVVVKYDNNKPSNNLPDASNNPNVINKADATDPIAKTSTPTINKQESLTRPVVTKPTPQSSELKPDFASLKEDNTNLEEGSNNKKSRGLFRKIARTFEKRTNLSATDDNRLLVAGLSFKLK